jgi:predicted molibdopterin-dependent oxidoreductase YjgC
MEEGIVEVYEKEEEIKKLTEKLSKFSFDELKKTDHFFYSINEKGTNTNFLKENFSEIEKVKLVSKRKHRNGKISYDFYYELENGTYLMYGISFEEGIPTLLNGFKVDRNFRHFKKSLLKSYKKNLFN